MTTQFTWYGHATMGLEMLLGIGHLIIHAAKQVNDKIFGGHEGTLLESDGLLEQCTS
ncbi:MAG TPA: hypothetical protein VIS10_08645 [Anaerolineales bacterium]